MLEKKNVLENKVRNDLYQIILNTEGIHYKEIQRKSNKTNGVTSYHLDTLEKYGFVYTEKDGRYKRYFVNHKFDSERRSIICDLRRKTTGKIIHYLLKHKKVDRYKELATHLNITTSAVGVAIKKLKMDNIIKIHKDWQENKITINKELLPKIKKIVKELGEIKYD
jgi:predicted transcriptional regulator